MSKLFALIIGIQFLALGCIGQSSVQFETIEQGQYSGHSDYGEYIIRNAADWQNLWDIVHSGSSPVPPLPEANFSEEILIAVFAGEKPTGGYSIEINKISSYGNIIDVTITETIPGSRCILTQALTQPYHIVKISRTERDISFAIEQRIVEC